MRLSVPFLFAHLCCAVNKEPGAFNARYNQRALQLNAYFLWQDLHAAGKRNQFRGKEPFITTLNASQPLPLGKQKAPCVKTGLHLRHWKLERYRAL